MSSFYKVLNRDLTSRNGGRSSIVPIRPPNARRFRVLRVVPQA